MSYFDSLPSLERARLRAHGRETLQRMGLSEADLPAHIPLESAGCIRRPDEWLPFERVALLARGQVLAREHGWVEEGGE